MQRSEKYSGSTLLSLLLAFEKNINNRAAINTVI